MQGLDRATGFFGCLTPRADAVSAEGGRRAFLASYGADPDVFLETPSFALHLGTGPGVRRGSDPARRVTVLMHGEIFLEGCTDPADVAERYLRMGSDFATDLNGTFVLLIADRVLDRVLLVTDRVGAFRIFHGIKDGHHWVAADLKQMPTHRFQLDAVGVAWYLANGTMHARRTAFDGIRVLRRASIHQVTNRGLDSRQYWDFSFPDLDATADEAELREELVRRMRLAVRRRAGAANLHLSLSGGWDSTSLAAILLDTPGAGPVRTLSYVYGDPAPGSDPATAVRLAGSFGLPHRLYPSYDDDLVDQIRLNARWGRGASPVVDEVHAWKALKADVADEADPVLFVGDHYLGENSIRMAHAGEQPLGKMRQFHRLRWLAPHLPSGLYDRLQEGTAHDVEQALGRVPGAHATGGYMFVDQRLPNTVLPWRQCHPGRFLRVRWPLLDYDLLDWTCQVPRDMKRANLYQTTAEAAFPEAFRIPRATHAGYYPPLQRHAHEQRPALERLAVEPGSRLDEVLPPELGRKLLEIATPEPTTVRRVKRAVTRRLGSVQVRLRRRMGKPPIGNVVAPVRVLRSYLVLREALRPDPPA